MTTTFTLAHFSDVHLSPLIGLELRSLTLKRALGALNWARLRRYIHKRDVADALMADVRSLNVDHVVITGDLVNLGLPAEYDAARVWLEAAAPPDRLTVIPGNHDIYAPNGADDVGVGRWADYMSGDAATLAFPFVRRVGPVALVCLNSAIATPPFYASGRLGGEQIDIAKDLLERLRGEGAIRVVLIHHPPLPGMTPPRRALSDAAHMQHVLERSGADLVLYGHNHRVRCDWLTSNARAIPIVAAASASAARTHGDDQLASYNLFTFFTGAQGVRIRWTVRGYAEPGGGIVKISEKFLTGPD